MKKIYILCMVISILLFILFPYVIKNLLVAWGLTILSVIAFFIFLGYFNNNKPLAIFIDSRNKASLSIFQIILWTTFIISTIMAISLHNIQFCADAAIDQNIVPNIPTELMVLMGISSISFIGSPIIKDIKLQKNILKQNDNITEASFSDVFKGEENSNNSIIDIGKVQMFLFTVIAISIYIVLIIKLLKTADCNNNFIESLPPLNENLVYVIGISHAGYLMHKAIPRT